VEDWEKDCINHNDPVSERRLLEKYKGLKFFDAKYNVYQTVCSEGLEWRTRDRRNSNSYTGWYIICQDEEGEETPWYICQS
jgi:hypothetical protein